MDAMKRVRQVGVAVAASLLVAVTAASATGCNLLKGKQQKAFAETCSQDSDCASSDCAGQGNICSKACTYNKDCGGGYVCRQKDDGSGEHCASAIGQTLNGSCMDPSDCENGHCLKHVGEDNAPGICSRFCAGPEDCPDGMKVCSTISDTGVLKMCLPGGAGTPVAQFGTIQRKATTTTLKPTATVPPVAPPVATVPPPSGGPILSSRTAAPVATATTPPAKTATPPSGVIRIKPRK